MKNEDLNNRRSTDSEWNWINKHAGHYHTRQEVSSFLGNERIRVTFSNKMEDNKQKNSDKIMVNEKPEKEVRHIEKPEIGNGGEINTEKPEIRYDIE